MVHNDQQVFEEIVPGFHGTSCPHNGLNEDKQCLCEECDAFLICFPDWKEDAFFENMQITVKNRAGQFPAP